MASSTSALTRARLLRPTQATSAEAVEVPRIEPQTKADLVRQTNTLSEEAAQLKNIAHAFERWHQDMISLTQQNREMHHKGDDLVLIVRQLIMLSLNAAIEAAFSSRNRRCSLRRSAVCSVRSANRPCGKSSRICRSSSALTG